MGPTVPLPKNFAALILKFIIHLLGHGRDQNKEIITINLSTNLFIMYITQLSTRSTRSLSSTINFNKFNAMKYIYKYIYMYILLLCPTTGQRPLYLPATAPDQLIPPYLSWSASSSLAVLRHPTLSCKSRSLWGYAIDVTSPVPF